MKPKPNPEVFARTVLAELAELRGEVFATRLRLYQLMTWMHYPKPQQEMEAEDKTHIQEFQKASLSKSCKKCGLAPNPKSPHDDDLYT